ncbi:MAG: glycosyltransferase family 2 protein [Anaerolineales bacterium]|jgi:glycosyltransferase involved in cell wall biosynthesis
MHETQPLVSIITPSFNQAEFLDETIRSVLEQDYPKIEYIIVDGGSTDGSLDVIRKYESQLDGWVSEADTGQTDAINKGFGMAKGDIFAWINSDDMYLPGAVSEAVRFFQNNPHVGMVYGNAYYIDEQSRPIALYPAGSTDYLGLRRGVNTIPQQATFFRSILWRMVGPLDPSFYYAMDYDLWTRISSVTPIRFHDKFMAYFRLQSASKSMREASRCWPEMMRIHFREGGSRFSVIYLKYLVRRVVEPIMPWRIRLRRWRFSRGKGIE